MLAIKKLKNKPPNHVLKIKNELIFKNRPINKIKIEKNCLDPPFKFLKWRREACFFQSYLSVYKHNFIKAFKKMLKQLHNKIKTFMNTNSK